MTSGGGHMEQGKSSIGCQEWTLSLKTKSLKKSLTGC